MTLMEFDEAGLLGRFRLLPLFQFKEEAFLIGLESSRFCCR
jgi:hypothetical protein